MIILSNNQWKNDENNDIWRAMGDDCSAQGRVDGLIDAYLEAMPDIIGMQEVSELMADLLMAGMNKKLKDLGLDACYSYISGRDTPLAYRSDLLSLIESGFMLFPEEVPGLDGSFNNGETKSYSYGVFRERKSGKLIAVLTVHLWWKLSDPNSPYYQPFSDEARTWQLCQTMQKMDALMAKYSCPGIILGDFNAEMPSECMRTAYQQGWRDVHDMAVGERDDTRGYHRCGAGGYSRPEPLPFERALDHIMLKSKVPVIVQRFCRICPEWFDRISDHYPLYTEISF